MALQHVLIPWFDSGSRERRHNLDLLVLPYWFENFPGWPVEVVEQTDTRRPFNKAKLVNHAAARSDARVIVLADADSIADPAQVRAMVERAHLEPRLVYGYTQYLCLSEQTTGRIGNWRDVLEAPAAEEHHLMGSTGCCAIQRKLYLRMGGMEEQYEGWGYEDLEFGLRAQLTLGSVERIPGDLTHLWHPRAPHVRANERLYERQKAAMIEQARSQYRRTA